MAWEMNLKQGGKYGLDSSGQYYVQNPDGTRSIFNEEQYLAANPDVANEVTNKGLTSGLNHWLTWGLNEGRSLAPQQAAPVGALEGFNPDPGVSNFNTSWANTISAEKAKTDAAVNTVKANTAAGVTNVPTSTPLSITGASPISSGTGSAGGTTGSVPLTHVVPGTPSGSSQVNIQDYAGQLAHDPKVGMSDEMVLGNKVPKYSDSEIAAGTIGQQPSMNPSQFNAGASTVSQVATAQAVDPRSAVGYDASTTLDKTQQNDMQAAQGTLSSGSQVNIREIDTEATGRGENEVGKALNTAAILDLNDVDGRATLKGQIGLLQDEFKDADGNPIVPPWASGIARQVSKIAAFKGITGTAATEAMSNALLEASIKVAEQDARFFQTVSLQNLNNQQQSVINKANVLASMDMKNLDARTTAAVENARNFMQMDLTNLNNQQQAAVINTQQRFQSILEDAKAINTARMFEAENENEMAKFYDTLNSNLQQFNSAQVNAMSQFNAGEQNAIAKFNSELQNQRDQFYRTMQYNIDVSNADWRRSIAKDENQKEFEAAAFDVKNAVNISQEALNQLWDRSDALLDYVWKSAENEIDRDRAILIAQISASTSLEAANIAANANKPGVLDVIGNIGGALLGKWLGAS